MIHPQALIKLFTYSATLVIMQSSRLSHADSVVQPPFARTSYNWVLGHIISSRSWALQLVGQPALWTDAQRRPYRNGTVPDPDHDPEVIALPELIQAFTTSQ